MYHSLNQAFMHSAAMKRGAQKAFVARRASVSLNPWTHQQKKEVTMNTLDIVKKALLDIEKGTIDASAYTEDMTLSGPVPKPLNRNEYISLMKNLVGAAPDWNFHARNFTVRGDTVKVTVNITGTQTNTLPAIIPGMSALPPTNKRFTLPEEHLAIKVQGDKISETVVDAVPGGGVMGIVSQLGAQLKKAA
jgi:hypothetical protein